MNRFGYLRDPVFWVSSAAYAFNRLFLRSHLGALRHSSFDFVRAFFHSHFDDLLLIPAALPLALWIQRELGLRKHDLPPTWPEMLGHLTVWSVMCKGVGPFWLHIGTPDPWDLVAYAAGGVLACLWWNRRAFRPSPARP